MVVVVESVFVIGVMDMQIGVLRRSTGDTFDGGIVRILVGMRGGGLGNTGPWLMTFNAADGFGSTTVWEVMVCFESGVLSTRGGFPPV